MEIYSMTDVGLKRSSNQDAFFAGELLQGAAFAVVCDGMGGANAGNVASQTAVKIISEYILRSYRDSMKDFEIEKMLMNAIDSANMEVYEKSVKETELSGMGTTAVIALVQGDTVVFAHVGDSRLYLVDDDIVQLTKDHSMVQKLIESGKITPEDAKVHPTKNVITRALGVEANVISDSNTIQLKEGQSLLLCTDGLSGFVDKTDILNVFKTKDIDSAADELIRLANENGGGDNITAVILSNT